MAIVLASASPRRAELMRLVTPNYEVLPLFVREESVTGSTPARLAQKLSELKCRAGALRRPYDVVIGCDTVVDYEGRVFGKPTDKEDARRMLRTLSGRTHLVHTGVCIFYDGSETEFVTTTRVSFLNISDADIDAYIATGEPMDKAGAYGIQGQAARFVEGINGCYYNVMGLPVSRLYQTLLALGCIRLAEPQPQEQISLFDIPAKPQEDTAETKNEETTVPEDVIFQEVLQKTVAAVTNAAEEPAAAAQTAATTVAATLQNPMAETKKTVAAEETDTTAAEETAATEETDTQTVEKAANTEEVITQTAKETVGTKESKSIQAQGKATKTHAKKSTKKAKE